MRLEKGGRCYGLFIDLNSAYNTVRHELIFKLLKNILEENEIKFIIYGLE